MKGGTAPQGYTGLEAMIFLVVSGFILASALVLVNGQQARTQYTQGIRDFDAKILQTINDVEVGYFPQDNLVCQIDRQDRISATKSEVDGTITQGTNADCIFLGNQLVFPSNNEITVIPLAALREEYDNKDNQPILNLNKNWIGSLPGLAQKSELLWGIMRSTRTASGTASTGVYLLDRSGQESSEPISRLAFVQVDSTDIRPSVRLFAGRPGSDLRNHRALVDVGSKKIVFCLQSADGRQRGAVVLGDQRAQLRTVVYEDLSGAPEEVQVVC
jgi:hypothetical protein